MKQNKEGYDWENDSDLSEHLKKSIRKMGKVIHIISLQIEEIDSPAAEITPEQREKAKEISRILKEHCETLDIKICMDLDGNPDEDIWELKIFGSLEYTQLTEREHQVLDRFDIIHGTGCASISLDELDNCLNKLKRSDKHA